MIFEAVWQDLEAEYGRANLRFPKELILLGGAPGAGKGTNTAFISRARGLTCPPIVISTLLDSPEARAIKDAGQLVGDREVVEKHVANIFAKLGLPSSDSDNRRVLAVLRHVSG
jgi:adenylate kinase